MADDESPDELPRLDRGLPEMPSPAPIRIVHLGLGNFHRAHQAWYTDRAPDAAGWGIAAFTGRRPDAAEALAPQDGLFTLITRSATEDSTEVIGSISAVHPATDHEAYLDLVASPEVVIITLTITEAGYQRDTDGGLDAEAPPVAADIAALRADLQAPVGTTPAKLVAGLAARRAADAGPITVLSCDNLPGNGEATARVVTDFAALLADSSASSDDGGGLLGWITDQVDFATSMVDRITPATTDEDRTLVAHERGYLDAAPVPTEPFSEWVIAGAFPGGRPAWHQAGAQLVDDVTPYEERKLWMLNGAHSLLAYVGSIRGHQTIAEAIEDPECRRLVDLWWDEAAPHLSLPAEDVRAYRAQLLGRFGNPRVRHLLAQVAKDGSNKIPVRIPPVLRAEREAGRLPEGAITAIAAWVLHLRGHGAPVNDAGADRAQRVANHADLPTAVAGVLDLVLPGSSSDRSLVEATVAAVERLHPSIEL